MCHFVNLRFSACQNAIKIPLFKWPCKYTTKIEISAKLSIFLLDVCQNCLSVAENLPKVCQNKTSLTRTHHKDSFFLPLASIIYNAYISNVRIEYPRNASESTQQTQESTQQNDNTFNISSNKWIIPQSIGIIFNNCLSKSTKYSLFSWILSTFAFS